MGLSLTADERIAALERRCADVEFSLDVERVRREQLENRLQALEQARPADWLPDSFMKFVRKLELHGGFDAELLLMPGTIGASLLRDELKTATV